MSFLDRLGACALSLCCAPAIAQVPTDTLLIDSFEALRALRIDSLQLRDPHLFRDLGIIGCLDVTGVLNDALDEQFAADADGDGFLDRSPLQLFRGLRTDGRVGQVTTLDGQCTAPAAGTTCSAAPAAMPVVQAYAGQTLGTCLADVPDTLRPYSPALQPAVAPCQVGATVDQVLDLGGLLLPLRSTTLGARLRENPTPGLANGVMRGFVSETVAGTIQLPAEFGGGTLASVLPGGLGSCASGDDRDQLEGESGWWFYLQYAATEVDFGQ